MECGGRRVFSSVLLAVVALMSSANNNDVAMAQSWVPGPEEANFKGINKYCVTAFDMPLCTKMVNGATNWDAAVKNAVGSTIEFVKAMEAKTLADMEVALKGVPNDTKEQLVSGCNSDYERVMDGCNQAINDADHLSVHLNGVLTLMDCLQNFSDFEIPVPALLDNMSKDLNTHIANLYGLAKLQYA